MTNDLLKAIFDEPNANILVAIPWQWGSRTEQIYNTAEADLYLANPYAFAALRHGVSEQDFRCWHEDHGGVRCSAITSRGKPCKNIAVDGHNLDLHAYLHFRACGEGFCWAHGD